jgi:hypothetical protein
MSRTMLRLFTIMAGLATLANCTAMSSLSKQTTLPRALMVGAWCSNIEGGNINQTYTSYGSSMCGPGTLYIIDETKFVFAMTYFTSITCMVNSVETLQGPTSHGDTFKDHEMWQVEAACHTEGGTWRQPKITREPSNLTFRFSKVWMYQDDQTLQPWKLRLNVMLPPFKALY